MASLTREKNNKRTVSHYHTSDTKSTVPKRLTPKLNTFGHNSEASTFFPQIKKMEWNLDFKVAAQSTTKLGLLRKPGVLRNEADLAGFNLLFQQPGTPSPILLDFLFFFIPQSQLKTWSFDKLVHSTTLFSPSLQLIRHLSASIASFFTSLFGQINVPRIVSP